jgi:hypothetical protein
MVVIGMLSSPFEMRDWRAAPIVGIDWLSSDMSTRKG